MATTTPPTAKSPTIASRANGQILPSKKTILRLRKEASEKRLFETVNWTYIMRMREVLQTALVCVLGLQAGAQGTFQNLNFEAANVSGYQPGSFIPATAGFPGWQASTGTTPTSEVLYDNETLGAPSFSIQDAKAGIVAIQGNYTAFLESASDGVPLETSSVTLSQMGIVPSGTESIQLDANELNNGSFAVMLGADVINMVPLEAFPGYTLYGGNISAWAGQGVALSITQLAPPTGNGEYSPSVLELDNITFSPKAVPEPGILNLIVFSGIAFCYRRCNNTK